MMVAPPSPRYSHPLKDPSSPQYKAPNMAHQLLTPEEPLIESFTTTTTTTTTTLPPIRTAIEPTTPVSPAFRTFASISDGGFSQHDEALYPDHNTVEAVDKPLFDTDNATQRDSLSPTPERALPVRSTNSVTSPIKMLENQGFGYWQQCMAELEWMRDIKRQLPPLQHSATQKRDRFTRQQLSMLDAVRGNSRVQKLKVSSKVATVAKPKAPTLAPNGPTTDTPAKRSRRKTTTPDARALTPDAKPRTRAPATKKKDGPSPDGWFKVEDFCPPASSLDESSMTLVLPDWKSSAGGTTRPLDLSKDPDLKHLAPKEVDLASALRLPCNMYLLCKRNIFAAKLKWLKEAKEGSEIKGEFNKTAAQNVCTIDVNKVSKLWTAFNRVGWFDEHWYQQWL